MNEEKDIDIKAKKLAEKLYQDNKDIIDEITNEKDTLKENNLEKKPYKVSKNKGKKFIWVILGFAAIILFTTSLIAPSSEI